MTTAKLYTKGGFLVDEHGRKIVRDGEFVRVSMMMSDGKTVVPGAVDKTVREPPVQTTDRKEPIADADRIKMYRNSDARMSDAWKKGAAHE